MKIKLRDCTMSCHIYDCTCEHPIDRLLNDEALITLCDQNGDYVRTLNILSSGMHPGHFGGKVERNGDQRVVQVYVD